MVADSVPPGVSTPCCPRCGTEVGATWRWCLACGYDPDGTQRRIRDAHIERHLRKGAWVPAVVVLAGMLLGATILWRTAPEDDAGTNASPTVAETADWQPFVPAGGGFRVEFPAPPDLDADPSDDGRPEQRYATMVDQQYYAVVVTDLGDGALDRGVTDDEARTTLEAYVGRSARSQGARVASTEPTHVRAAPALAYELTADATHTWGEAVLVGRQVFDVAVSGPDPGSADADRFLASFSLG